MLLNKRGAALLQVLIVTAILAGMSAMILRLSLSRTLTSRQTRHIITSQSVVEACMAEVNMLWASKTPAAYARDLANCQMCDPTSDTGCPENDREGNANSHVHMCTSVKPSVQHGTYTVEAKMEPSGTTPPCKITYTVLGGRTTL